MTFIVMDLRLFLFTIVAFVFTFVSVFWMLTLFEEREHIKRDPKPKTYLSLSVIVPAYNEEETIQDCIKSLLKLKYPIPIKIIVVDDGSTDKTKEKVEKIQKDNSGIILLGKENGGKASAMNYGLQYVDTELVACLDADSMIPNPRILDVMLGYFARKEVAAVTPALKVYQPKNTLQEVQWIEYLLGQLLRKLSAFLDVILVAPGPFTVYRTSVLREIGGFDSSTLTEDMEIAYRIHKYGYSIENSVNAEVYTIAPSTLESLFKQRLRWSRGTYQNMYKYIGFLFNRNYGTVGLVIFPLSVLTLVFLPLTILYTTYLLFTTTYDQLTTVYYMLTLGIKPELKLDLLASFLGTNFYTVFLIVLSFTLAIILLYLSHKYTSEKIDLRMKLAYAAYIFVFYFLLHIIFVVALSCEILGVSRKW